MAEAALELESGLARFWRALRRSPKGLTGFVLIALALGTALAAPLLAPHDPARQVIEWRFLPPAWEDGADPAHFLGGDDLGRDIFSRVLLGARVSITVAIIVVILAMTIGSLLGAVAGYFGGVLDAV